MAVIIDIKDGARISRDKNGYRTDRVAIVTGVTGTASQRLYNAITDASLPAYGSAHPSISTIYLNDISGEVIDTETVRLTLSYYNDPASAEGGETSLRISSSTTVEQVDIDENGNRLEARFIALIQPASSGDPLSIATGSRLWTAEVERPITTFDFNYTSSVNPYSSLTIYEGAVNSVMWNGKPAGTVLCSSIDIDNQGTEYKVRISFTVNDKGWQFKGAVKTDNLILPLNPYTTPDTGLDLHTGVKIFDLLPTADFTPLGFDIGIVAASVTGTAAVNPSIDGADIDAGGKTIVITLYNDTWVASGATFDAQRQNIIDGITSNKNEAAGWNAELALGRILQIANVVRTSDTIVTITFVVDTVYLITERENIDVVIPSTALTSAAELTAKPVFSINPE